MPSNSHMGLDLGSQMAYVLGHKQRHLLLQEVLDRP